jgi:hypothetical protein
MNHWWTEEPAERYWLETTDREDLGADLRAPETDDSGRDNWRYTLFKYALVGDIVLHYRNGGPVRGIVGWSRISGRWHSRPIVWAARGTYARDKGTRPHERPGFVVPLSDSHWLPTPITVDQIRGLERELRALVETLKRRHNKPLCRTTITVADQRQLGWPVGPSRPKHFESVGERASTQAVIVVGASTRACRGGSRGPRAHIVGLSYVWLRCNSKEFSIFSYTVTGMTLEV